MEEHFKVSLNEYLPLRDVVFNHIRDAIISGKLQPGERLMEKQLAAQIGVSRTPIREALRKLELEGFVHMVPRKGAMVSVMSENDIRNVLEIRATLEALAAKLACTKMPDHLIEELKKAQQQFITAARSGDVDQMAKTDTAFHELIFAASQNDKLVQLINQLGEQIYRYRIAYLKDISSRNSIIEDHEHILQSIQTRDEDAAAQAAVRHIENQQKAVIDALIS